MDNQNQPTTGQQTINVQVPSASNIASRRSLIPTSFVIAIICFFFTFCDLRCGGQKLASVSGMKLVTGTTISAGGDMFNGGGQDKGKEIPPNIWAILALASAVVGLGVYLIKEKREALIGTGAGAVGFGSLLILQFVVGAAVDEQGKGALEATFQFGYWGALIALLAGGVISYLRMRQTHNIVINYAQPNTEAVSNPSPPAQLDSSGFDIGNWFQKNKIIAGIIGGGIVILFGLYYFVFRADPARDGKNIAQKFCESNYQLNDELIKIDNDFVKSFDTYNFKKKQEARTKLNELQQVAYNASTQRNQEIQAKYNELKNKYSVKEEDQKAFDFAYTNNVCTQNNNTLLSDANTSIETKVATIKDPEPDIEKIKSDLLGKKILGWNFDFLNEFIKSEIVQTSKGSDRIEYQIKFLLHSGKDNKDYPCEVMVDYMQSEQGYYFNSVRCISITYTNIAPMNNWLRITPFQNATYTIETNDKYWVRDGSYGDKQQGGPDAPGVHLTTYEVYIMSRDDHPATLSFVYRPSN